MANQKISARTLLTGAGALSRPTARSGSTTNYRTVDNLIATADPAATDDSSAGYHVGSLWYRSDTTELWYCTDATASAAVWIPRAGQFRSSARRFYAYSDCLSASVVAPEFNLSWTGTGAAVSSVTIGSLNALGVISLDLGTSTGKVSINSSQTAILKFGDGRTRFLAKVAIPVLSDGTETFLTKIGFQDNFTGTPTDAIMFSYSSANNSGKWEAITRSNGTATTTDTTIAAVAGTHQRFRIDVNAAGTSVTFYIDDVLVATNTTNIPTGSGRETGYAVASEKTAGTTARSGAYVDYVEVEKLFTTAR